MPSSLTSAGRGYVTPQQSKRRRKDPSATTTTSSAENVAAAVQAARLIFGTQTRQQRVSAHTIPGECQLSYSAIRRRRVPRTVLNALVGAPVKLKIVNGSNQIDVSDGAQVYPELQSIMAVDEIGQIIADDWGGSDANARAVCMGGTFELMLTNHSSGVLRCILYVCIPKRDTTQSAPASFTAGFTAMGSDVATAQTFGMRPGDSPLFNEQWHIVSANQFCLSAGQTHIHKHDYDVEQILSGGTELPTQTYQKAWTVNFFLSVHGVATAAAAGNVTTGDGQLNLVWNRKIRWKFFEFQEGAEVDTARAIPAAGTITSRMYNPDTGAVGDIGVGD